MLTPEAPATGLRLLSGDGSDDPCGEAALRTVQVVVPAAHHRHPDAGALDEVDEALELFGGPVEAVVVPGDDGIDLIRFDCPQQLMVGATGLAAVGGPVAVLQVAGNCPAPRAA